MAMTERGGVGDDPCGVWARGATARGRCWAGVPVPGPGKIG